MEAGKETGGKGNEVAVREQFNKFLARYGEEEVKDIVNEELPNSKTKTFIIDFTRLHAAVFDSFLNGFSKEELNKYTDTVSRMSFKYKNNSNLVQHMTDWCESRNNLIEIAKSSASELDQNLFAVFMARMIGASVELLYSLNLGIYKEICSGVSSYVSNISPAAGLAVESALQLVPHLRYMGFVSSFFEIMQSEQVIGRVVVAMKKDKDLFEPLREWFAETDEFEESVKKLFPYEIDKAVIGRIEEALKDLGEEQKIFASALMSNIRKEPGLYKDGKFLAKVFLFCRSDAAKEWYRRMTKGDRPSDHEKAMMFFRSELQELERRSPDFSSTIEIGKFSVQPSTLPRVILCGMSGLAAYYSYKRLQSGSKHRYSDGLRELARNGQRFLDTMKEVRRRHQLRMQ